MRFVLRLTMLDGFGRLTICLVLQLATSVFTVEYQGILDMHSLECKSLEYKIVMFL